MLNTVDKADVKTDEEAAVAAPPEAAPAIDPDAIERRKVIEATIESIRPNLQRDKGDCELVDVQGDKVYVKMTGACVGCQLSSLTLNGVQAKLVEATGRMIRVIPVSQMHRL
jgi:Fe-S cluster biogenesis protein NfuA